MISIERILLRREIFFIYKMKKGRNKRLKRNLGNDMVLLSYFHGFSYLCRNFLTRE
jgi:hypothetical protein